MTANRRQRKSFLRFAHHFARCEAGGVAIMFGLMAVAIMSLTAVAIDGGLLYVTKSRLQTSADAAALAAFSSVTDEATAIERAKLFAQKNAASSEGKVICAINDTGEPDTEGGSTYCNGDIAFGGWDANTRVFTVGATPYTAVRVIARRSSVTANPVTLIFARIFGKTTSDVSVVSIVAVGSPPTCMLALNQSDPSAVELNSNATVTLSNCGMQINSSNGAALKTDSNAVINSDWVSIVGSYNRLGSSSISPAPETGAEAKADPLAGLPVPSFSGCTYSSKQVYDNITTTIMPGVYCGGIEIKGDAVVTMSPGTYVIKDGELFVDSNSTLKGDEVFIFLTGSSGLIRFDSNAVIQLSAPTSGTYAGIVFFQDRNFGGIHSFDSNTSMKMEGVAYFPAGTVSVDSNAASQLSGCSFFIANKYKFDSNGGLDITYEPTNCGVPIPSELTGKARLVR